jgi:hypothetical protein
MASLPLVIGALLWPACLCSVALGPIMFSFFACFATGHLAALGLDRGARACRCHHFMGQGVRDAGRLRARRASIYRIQAGSRCSRR